MRAVCRSLVAGRWSRATRLTQEVPYCSSSPVPMLPVPIPTFIGLFFDTLHSPLIYCPIPTSPIGTPPHPTPFQLPFYPSFSYFFLLSTFLNRFVTLGPITPQRGIPMIHQCHTHHALQALG
ncbi:hypothetical protein PoB_001931100 [Plakobranchus ocellatus]|uniref:Uncharacterized protein n=1 Tax=Plakobranchus ocellatus TaxID=259542 RepID=A0AAV3ZA42_9GAST|nr:hypothetical protein PoB_001931100 [Plakobranchus ocellatus]